jgi:hypothetical protein
MGGRVRGGGEGGRGRGGGRRGRGDAGRGWECPALCEGRELRSDTRPGRPPFPGPAAAPTLKKGQLSYMSCSRLSCPPSIASASASPMPSHTCSFQRGGGGW